MSKKTIFLLILSVLFFAVTSPAHASFLNSVITDVKEFFHLNRDFSSLSIDSSIRLTTDGDLDHNKTIDAGDIVTFSYKIINSTKNNYTNAMLKTGINANDINGVTNVRGAINVDMTKNTIAIPYLTLHPNQVMVISFDAQIDFYIDADHSIVTEAELIDKSNASLFKEEKKEIIAKKMDMDRFNKLTHTTK